MDEAGVLTATFDKLDSDGIGRLTVRAHAHGFGGRGSAWFNVEKVLAFAAALGRYPLSDPGPSIVGGFGSLEHRDELEVELLRLEVRPIGPRGQLALVVHVATEYWPAEPPSPRGDATFDVYTTFEQLRRFSDELAQTVRGELTEARLDGEMLA